jgi:ribonucleoside-diphosphate reductase alpha chain
MVLQPKAQAQLPTLSDLVDGLREPVSFESVRHLTAEQVFDGDTFAIDAFTRKYSHKVSMFFGPLGQCPLPDVTYEDERKETPAEAMLRVAYAAAAVETDEERRRHALAFWFDMLWNRMMVPGGRPYYGLGTLTRKISLINCTTVGAKPDTLEGIFEMGFEVAKVESRGEGVGADITGFRPKGMATNNAAKTTSGAVHWGEIADWSTGAISQEGRRGALLLSIGGRHPEAYGGFITVKSEEGKIINANISIKIDDEMMQAYESGETIELYWDDEDGVRHSFGHVDMREYMGKIASNARDYAEPGVLFWTTAQLYSNSDALGDPRWEIVGVNACSEQPLNHLGQCTLAHQNWGTLPTSLELAKREAFLRSYYVHWFLDNVVQLQIDEERYALPEQLESLVALRRVGVGYTGVADILIRMGVPYDSEEGIAIAEELAREHCRGAYRSSVDLGKLKGPFPANNPNIKNSLFIQAMLEEGILTEEDLPWLRNVCSLTVAPTGTGSLMVQTYGSGCEPGFGFWMYRRQRTSGQYMWYFKVDPFVKRNCEMLTGLPWPFTNEQENDEAYEEQIKQWLDSHIDPTVVRPAKYVDSNMKLRLMGKLQKYIDSAISVTFNLVDATVEDVERIYVEAWKQKLKGCSVYIYNDKNREPIIQWVRPITYNFAPKSAPPATPVPAFDPEEVTGCVLFTQEERARYEASKRPDRLKAETIIRKGEGKKWYFTLSTDDSGKLAEVFVNTSDEEEEHTFPDVVLEHVVDTMRQHGIPTGVIASQMRKSVKERDYIRLSRMISISLRWGVLAFDVVQSLRAGAERDGGLRVGTLLFHLVHLLEEHVTLPEGYSLKCNECKSTNLLFKGGCHECADCGSQKCG